MSVIVILKSKKFMHKKKAMTLSGDRFINL